MRVESEDGRQWLVQAGDPARKLINRLHGLGFEYIVLPYEVLTSGAVRGTMGCRGGETDTPSLDPPLSGATPELSLRPVRLRDCLGALASE